MYKQKYLKYKNKYLQLKEQKGGTMSKDDFESIKKHNINIYFDKGDNNIWAEKENKDRLLMIDNERKNIQSIKLPEFENYLSKTMEDRYYVRNSNLVNLLGTMEKQYGNIINMKFIDEFYINLFKGTAHKQYFPQKTQITDELLKRYNIYLEYEEQENKLPIKKYFTFTDSTNPCHLIKILKDPFERENDENLKNSRQIVYAFKNIKELGKGKAGTASLFGYNNNNELKIAAKLMANTQFNLTNNGKYLPIQILYIDNELNKASVPIETLTRNTRYICTKSLIDGINIVYPGYSNFNVFGTDHNIYKKILLSVASDNFSNQTIMHIILEKILEEHNLNNYIKQYDAMLCYNTETTFLNDSWYDWLKDNTYYAANMIGNALNLASVKIDGLNFMELADGGDLYGHLFDIQKNKFSKIRTSDDLLKDPSKFSDLKLFLDEMIIQLLKPLSILQHPKYAFVHGDLKTKNVFVRKDGDKFVYKLADYDKSSITYNGIRFYNEGNAGVKFVNSIYPPSLYQKDIDINTTPDQKNKDIDFNKLNLLLNSNIDNLVDSDNDNTSVIYEALLNADEKDIKQALTYIEKNKNEFHGKLKAYFKKMYVLITKEESVNDDIETYIKKINDIKKGDNLYYTINSLIAKASIFINKLEGIELEQLYVRYSPVPFYPTIDLYTLFLSLLQSPMIYTYLSYCNQYENKEEVKNSVFWLSFKDLWSTKEDIYSILGYFDYYYLNPPTEDTATIGFILDPIKKNPIPLLKRLNINYWERCWPDKMYDNIKAKLNQRGNIPSELKLSAGTSVTMPQICVSDCKDFEMMIHRGSTVYYLNKDLIVYNVTGLVEKGKGFSKKFATPTNENIESKKKEYLHRVMKSIYNYLKSFESIIEDKSISQLLKLKENGTARIQGEFVPEVFYEDLVKTKFTALYENSTQLNMFPTELKNKIDNIIKQANIFTVRGKWKVSDFTSESMKNFLEDKYSEKSKYLKNIIVEYATGTHTTANENAPKILTQIFESLEKKINNKSIEDEIRENIESDDYKNKIVGAIDESVDKEKIEFDNKIEQAKKKYDEETIQINKENTIQLVNSKEKIERIFSNLINYTPTKSLKEYIDEKFKNESLNNNLFNICRTNTYKDYFGNSINWDYCPLSNDDIIKILEKVQLF